MVGVPSKFGEVDIHIATKPLTAHELTATTDAHPIHNAAVQIDQPRVNVETQPIAPSAKSAGNAVSKQRAKARKQSGLQALLAKNKAGATNSSTGGLDLMDFLKMS